MNLLCDVLLISSTSLLIIYYLVVFTRIRKSHKSSTENEPVSVVICARNEVENLRRNLPLILDQKYPEFEVVVIDDASWDKTNELLEEISRENSKLKVVTITEEQKRTEGKKMALTLGFKKAKYARFLLTDADCQPRSNEWIKYMSAMNQESIVLGYGAYEKRKGLLNIMIRFDTWSIGVFYLSAAASGFPYMGVGRNLCYTRNIYEGTGGFKRHYHIASGDDDLFVNQVARGDNTRIATAPNSHTISSAPISWQQWTRQKTRHLSVSKYYTYRSKVFLGVYQLSLSLFYASIAICLISNRSSELLLGMVLLKTLIHLLISIYPSKELKENDMLALLPVLEPIMLVLNLFFGLAALTSRNKAWK
ncbi:MAG: glycosyltransferase [Flavobacteriales bacterium]|nr:glycosyltransferase [Flavobacteriales bacterium]